MAAASVQKSETRPSLVVFDERFSIRAEEALPEFSTPTARAYAALDTRNGGMPTALMALIVDPAVPYRADALGILKGVETPGQMTLIDYAVIEWPAFERKALAILYERPTGGRLTDTLEGEMARFEPGDLLKKVMRPIARGLRQLAKHKLTHRAVRPTNMFWATPERIAAVLGDCVAAPPGFDQPLAFETIESALAHPAGRGNGTEANDLYALGASMLMLLAGRNPLARMSGPEIIRAKMLDGSYQIIAGAENVPVQLIEMVKGLLSDDPKTRWDHAALEDWLAGKRRPVAQTKIEKRAARGFEFKGQEYFSTRELAVAFCANWEAAIPAANNGQLEQWLRHALSMDLKADAIAKAIRNRSVDTRNGADDALLCRICLILDDLAPIRFKTMAAMPDGIGALLAVTMAKGQDVNPVVRLLRRDIQTAWHDTREGAKERLKPDSPQQKAAETLSNQAIGYGIERVLYDLNESVPCQSPLIVRDFVVDIRNLLPALDRAAGSAKQKAWPIDRHMAAFIAARATMDINRQLVDVGNEAQERSALGMLNLLATLQWYLGPKQLQGLGALVGGLLKPIIDGYHSQRRRRQLERDVSGPVGQGDLVGLFRLLDDADERNKDRLGYEKAAAEWQELEEQVADVDKDLRDHTQKAADAGRRASAVVSMGIAILTVMVLILAKRQ